MDAKIKDLSVDELKKLISDTVEESMEDILEDFLAASSKRYIESVSEARSDYKSGKHKSLKSVKCTK